MHRGQKNTEAEKTLGFTQTHVGPSWKKVLRTQRTFNRKAALRFLERRAAVRFGVPQHMKKWMTDTVKRMFGARVVVFLQDRFHPSER